MVKLRINNAPKMVIIDDEDLDKLKSNDIRILLVKRAVIVSHVKTNFMTSLGRFLLDLKDPKLLVDHIDGNILNNQKSNLRICNTSQNAMNMIKRKSICTSKYKGVHWNSNYKGWVVQIRYGGKTRHIGYYTNEIDAAIAYNIAALKYFKDFARLNIID